MYYLTLAMKTINITQKPGSSFSHRNGAMDLAGVDAGIDFFFCRTGHMKCISLWRPGYNTYMFQPCDADGHAVKVRCADGVDRIVTIAMTHSGLKYVHTQVGKIYSQNEPLYEEGRKGFATGNHIHIEVATGTRTDKYYDPQMRVYRMRGELNPARVFYIDDSFSKVKDMDGLTMMHVSGPEVPESSAASAKAQSSTSSGSTKGSGDSIELGYHIYTRHGITARTYRAAKPYTLHLISAGGSSKVQQIGSFDSDKLIKVAVLNCNYFDLETKEHYGVEQDSLVAGYHQEPKNAGLLAYYVDKADYGHVTKSDSYFLTQDAVQCAITPYAVTLIGGTEVNYRSTNLKPKTGIKDTQSAAARLKDGSFVLAAFPSCTPADVRTFFQSFEADEVQDVCVLDSGGSTQMRVWTGGRMQTVVTGDKRMLPNVLCLAKPAK